MEWTLRCSIGYLIEIEIVNLMVDTHYKLAIDSTYTIMVTS